MNTCYKIYQNKYYSSTIPEDLQEDYRKNSSHLKIYGNPMGTYDTKEKALDALKRTSKNYVVEKKYVINPLDPLMSGRYECCVWCVFRIEKQYCLSYRTNNGTQLEDSGTLPA